MPKIGHVKIRSWIQILDKAMFMIVVVSACLLICCFVCLWLLSLVILSRSRCVCLVKLFFKYQAFDHYSVDFF